MEKPVEIDVLTTSEGLVLEAAPDWQSEERLQFRWATHDDVARIALLVNSAYRGESSRQGWTTEADLLDGQRTDASELAELLALENSHLLLAVDREANANDAILAIAHLQQRGNNAYLGMVTVQPQLQGQGIGKLLMREAESRALALWQSSHIMMSVISVRKELIAFYQRQGYIATDEYLSFPTETRFGIRKVAHLELRILRKPLG